MNFEWDEAKARSNDRKHGVDFELAKRVFLDPNRKELDNGTHDGEERWSVLGSVGEYLIVVVIFTVRGIDEDTVRIISARRANKHERKSYYTV